MPHISTDTIGVYVCNMEMRSKFYSEYVIIFKKKEKEKKDEAKELMFRTKFGIVNLFHFPFWQSFMELHFLAWYTPFRHTYDGTGIY